MKLIIHNGATAFEFEGELAELDRLAEMIEIPRNLLSRLRAGANAIDTPANVEQDSHGARAPAVARGGGEIDVRALSELFRTREAKSDVDRVTLMAHVAIEAGLPGIDYETAERLFVELGERKPTRIRATFQNAKVRGLVRTVGRGIWTPTVVGENYARLGYKAPRSRSERPRQRSARTRRGQERE
jgi:hypothetical protein